MGKKLENIPISEDIWMARNHMKRYSILHVIRNCKLKTTMRYHYTSIRMAKNPNDGYIVCWWGWATRTPIPCCENETDTYFGRQIGNFYKT